MYRKLRVWWKGDELLNCNSLGIDAGEDRGTKSIESGERSVWCGVTVSHGGPVKTCLGAIRSRICRIVSDGLIEDRTHKFLLASMRSEQVKVLVLTIEVCPLNRQL